jgi:Predicted integral membrane protein (DUF2269)
VPIYKLVHILAMFAAFGLLLVPLYVLLGLLRSSDAHAVRATYFISKKLGNVAFVFFFLGLAGGVATLVTGGWSGTSPWLLATYGLLVLVAVLDGVLMGPWRRRVEQSFATLGPGSPPTADVSAALRSRQPAIYAWATTLVLAGITALMVLKPSFGV